MGNWWIRFGCFLTGYNYIIVRASSEVAAKAVKKFTAAMLIVCILWSFVGYTFAQRYLHTSNFGAFISAVVMVIMIVQIERQIILAVNPTFWLLFSRGLIAMLMAVIGSVIVDQIIFKEDIELEKITFLEGKIKKALPPRTEELRNQIAALDLAIKNKDEERIRVIKDVQEHPYYKIETVQNVQTHNKKTSKDSASGKTEINETSGVKPVKSTTVIQNPNQTLIPTIQQTIDDLRKQKTEKDNALLNIRPKLEYEIKSHIGFLDELKVMYNLIKESGVALCVWLIWFFFLMGLEMLVLIS